MQETIYPEKDQRIYTWMCIYWICMSLNIPSLIFRNLYLYEAERQRMRERQE